jgi:uncharacterized coiled-coil DUF342 family protein
MSDTKKLIEELDNKVDLLLNKIGERQTNLDSNKQELDELSKKLSDNETEIKKLMAENETLKSVPGDSSQDSENMKVKISELVKEIDNCISLLKV